jgi:hypothetical protein
MSVSEQPEKRRPGRPRHESQSTEHITVTPDLKAGLDFLRGVTKKRSFNDIVLMLFRSYSFTLRASTFLTTLAELNKREDETFKRIIG